MSTYNQDTRVLWACRRGMLELDLLLQPYAKNIYPTLSSRQQAIFRRLLHLDDPTLYAWLMSTSQSDDSELQYMIDHIRCSC